MKTIKVIGFAVLLGTAGCRTTKITNAWSARDTSRKEYKKIMVLGLIQQQHWSLRQKMEQHFVGDLANLGYSAVSSLQEYGPRAFDGLDEKTALEKIRSSGVDAVITIVLLDKKKESRYVAGQYNYVNNLWDYVGMRSSRIYEPGYYVTETKYFWESNFYEMETGSLLYAVQTKTFSPSGTESMGHEYGRLIVKDMQQKKLLSRQKEYPAGTDNE